MPGGREALVIANEAYTHAELAQLAAPSTDAAVLAGLLADDDVGGFHVQVHQDLTAQQMRVVMEAFLVERRPDDLAVLYFSGHGIKALSGALHLAAVDTDPRLLAATSLGCDFVQGLMAHSRARRIALFLDCCYGGAFVHGMTVKAGRDVHVRDTFADLDDAGEGRGRVIITAASATQFAFEDGHLRPGSQPEPSRFTRAVADGLLRPETDRDHDGWIGLHELFLQVEDSIRQKGADQTPQMWALGAQGDIRLARSPGSPDAVAADQERLQDVESLRLLLQESDLPRALAAHVELAGLTDHASPVVAEAALRALRDADLVVVPDELDLGTVEAGTWTAPRNVSVSGVPLARMLAVDPSEPWLQADRNGDLIPVRAAPPAAGPHEAQVRLTNAVGERRVRVTVEGTPSMVPRPVLGHEQPELASMGLRLVARLIDLTLFAIGFGIFAMLISSGSTAEGGSEQLSTGESIAFIALLAVYGVYEIALVAHRGQTLGKRLAQVRVVRADGQGPPGLGGASIRYVVQLFAWLTCLGAPILYASPYWDPGHRYRGWHDLAAGTLVVRATAPSPLVPPGS